MLRSWCELFGGGGDSCSFFRSCSSHLANVTSRRRLAVVNNAEESRESDEESEDDIASLNLLLPRTTLDMLNSRIGGMRLEPLFFHCERATNRFESETNFIGGAECRDFVPYDIDIRYDFCLLILLFALLALLLVCLLVCLFACLLVCLFAWMLVCLFACLFHFLLVCLPCLLAVLPSWAPMNDTTDQASIGILLLVALRNRVLRRRTDIAKVVL